MNPGPLTPDRHLLVLAGPWTASGDGTLGRCDLVLAGDVLAGPFDLVLNTGFDALNIFMFDIFILVTKSMFYI